MITWFQKTFGKHYKWALIVALSLLCLSTIVGIGAVPRGELTGRNGAQRMYLGLNLDDEQATQELEGAVQFTNQSLSGNPVSDEAELQSQIDERLALTQLANEWQIPEATPKQVEDYLRGLSVFHDAEGNFSPIAYTTFKDSIQALEPAKRDLALATIKANSRLERVREILGGPGYVLPSLAWATAGLNNLKLNLDATTLDFTKFEPTVGDVKDDVLQAIFTKYPDHFQKPAQARLSFAKIPAAAASDPTPAQLHDYAVAHKDAFPNIQPDKMSDKDKTAVTEAWRSDQKAQAEKDASDTAMKFARELFDLKAAPNSPEFAAVLKKYNLTLQPLPLLVQGTPAPADSPVPDDILQQMAFTGLTAQQPFAPVQLADGAAVLFLDEATPARAQTFVEAKDAVKAYYAEQEKVKQFTDHGNAVRDAIVKAMADGKTFTAAVEAQGLTVKNYPDVSAETLSDTLMSMPLNPADKTTAAGPLASMGRDMMMALTNATANQGPPLLLTLKPKEVSPLVPANGIGIIFYVQDRIVPPVAADSPEVKRADEAFKTNEASRGEALYLQRVIQDARDSLKQADSNQG